MIMPSEDYNRLTDADLGALVAYAKQLPPAVGGAAEVVLAGEDTVGHTFVFDEVDAGVGGAVGMEIGRRLSRLARRCQVIVVTHLAQVAAFADQHFVVAKASDGQVTRSDVSPLDAGQRVAELARMMGGSAGTEAALSHAAELRATAVAEREL